MDRGRLRIYIGYAPGVGKTFAMLGEGRRRSERGTDVVVGLVEPHGRSRTDAEAAGLEVIPPHVFDGPAGPSRELDVGAVLARRPEVVLVDELAHTNASGGRHEKRWQDVVELLDAGIDVISTVNIQHLDSLGDVIEGIVGSPAPDTVPDALVRGADQLELVDMTPQALRRRLAHGNVFPPEEIDARLAHLFREESLAALRELSLLWMADRVDESRRAVLAERDGAVGPRERVIVGVAGVTADAELLRWAARATAHGGGEMVAVHVIPQHGRRSAEEDLAATRSLVEDLGGVFEQVPGRSVPDGLLAVARAEQATRIVVGGSDRSRWEDAIRPSIASAVIRGSGAIGVEVIPQAAVHGRAIGRVPRAPALPRRRLVVGIGLGLVGVVALTGVLSAVHLHLGLPSIFLLYLTLVIAVAAAGGLWPAIVAAVASSLVVNWFFTPPLHTWTIAEPQNVFALGVFVLIAVVVSSLVAREARAHADAERVRTEAEALAHVAAGLAAEDDPLPGLVEQLRATFGLTSAAVLRPTPDGGWQPEASAGALPPRTPTDGTDTLELGEGGVLVLRGPALPADSRRLLGAFVAQLVAALRARMLAREAAELESLARVDALRTAILAAVSHDLRTPLASIKAAVSSLRDDEIVWPEREREQFLGTIEDGTDRLTRLIENLLDMSRLQTGTVSPATQVVGLDEVVPRALSSLPDDGRGIEIDVPETLPRIAVDPGLLERVIANLAANASQWTAPTSPVRIQGSSAAGRVELRVIDRGPGVRAADRERMFQPFQRLGDRSASDGVGLGLAVARGFVEAMEGRVEVEETPGGGLTMVIGFEAAPR